MKKLAKISNIFLCLLMVTTVFAVVGPVNVSAAGEFSSYFVGGDGTAGDPYQISDVDELQNMQLDVNANYVIVNDIDASETSTWNGGAGFEPIGYWPYFEGLLDGNGYKITGLYINRPSTNRVGLFSNLGGWTLNSVIMNIALENIDITGMYGVGGLVGWNWGSISNSYATGSINGKGDVGGLIAYNNGGPLSNCYSTGSVSATWSEGAAGGLVGQNFGPISNSYSSSSVNGGFYVGGLVGRNSRAIISNSYTSGIVTGVKYTGGLVGDNGFSTISNSYATGFVTGGTYTGGLVGRNYASTISNSYWDTETSGQSSSAGGTGKTTVQMKQQATFVGWEFTNIWDINEGVTYPYLWWENEPPVADAGSDQTVLVGETVNFDGSGSSDPDGTIDSYDWDFDDTNLGTGVAPIHSYSTVGTYIVTLTVTDDNGASDTDTVIITVITQIQATHDLIVEIEEMELPKGTENNLKSKLNGAIHLLEKENINGAIHKLGDFIDYVEAQRGKKLTNEEADALIAAAQAIIDNINGT